MNEQAIPDLLRKLKALSDVGIRVDADTFYTLECANGIWLLCPFRVEDRVRLKRTPVISGSQAWGWIGYRDVLVEGATATVKLREFGPDGRFRIGLVLDAHKDLERPGHFYFDADWLEKMP